MSQKLTTLAARAWSMRREPTPAEAKLWSRLRAKRLNGHKFRDQVVIEPYIVDFVCYRQMLIVEVDGSQHGDAVDYDEERTRYLERQGFRVLRFWNNDVLEHMPNVLEAILAALDSPLPGASRLSLSASQRGKE